MTKPTTITAEIARQLLRYDPETGKLYWRPRGNRSFDNKFAGKEAFTAVNTPGYHHGTIYGRTYIAHRVIWLIVTGAWPEDEIDHKNHNRLDNRWGNLRSVTRVGNMKNRPRQSNNRTGVTGVYMEQGRYRAAVGRKRVGRFDTLKEAENAVLVARASLGYFEGHGRLRDTCA